MTGNGKISRSQETRIEGAIKAKLQEKSLSDNPALSGTKKHGGQTRVMADRLKARQAGADSAQPSQLSETGELISTL
jgi:hypothetical protein